MKSIKFKYGILAVVVTALVIVVAIVVNVLASVLTDRLDLTLDLTASKAFSISENVEQAFASVDDEIKVTVLYEYTDFIESSPYFAQVAKILESAEEVNNKIMVQYISPISDPAIKSQYPELLVREGDVILHNATTGRAVELSLEDLFTLSSDGSSIASSQAEEKLAAGILALTGENDLGVGITEGHGETEYASLTSLLEINNYTVEKIGTLVKDIPSNVGVLFIPAPMSDFTADEIKLLESFLYNGGEYGTSIAYFASIEQPELPNLEGFLESYGLVVSDSYIRESNADNVMVTSTDSGAAVTYLDDDICSFASSASGYTVSAFTRSIRLGFVQSGSVSTSPILGFYSSAYEYPIVTPEGEYEAVLSGDLYAAVRSRVSVLGGGVPRSSNIVAFGSNLFIYDGLLTTEGVTNAEVIVGLMNFLAPNSISISAAPKTLGGTPITLAQGEAKTIGAVFMVVIPALVLVAGTIVFFRRRNR